MADREATQGYNWEVACVLWLILITFARLRIQSTQYVSRTLEPVEWKLHFL